MHVVTRPPEPLVSPGGRLDLHIVPAAADNLIWVFRCRSTGAVAVVDGPGAEALDPWLAERGWSVDVLLTTHTHGDHIGVHRAWAAAGTLPERVVGSAATADAIPGLTEAVSEGDEVRVGAVDGRVMRTDGHLTGHVSYVFDGALFCGDTLFAGGCGYLFDGPPEAMFQSLMRLAALPPETLVCCAHEYTQDNLRFAWSVEPDNAALVERIRRDWAVRAEGGCTVPSTIEVERATNPFLRPGAPTLVASVSAAMPERAMSTPAEVFAATRSLKDRGQHKSTPDADLPLV